MSFVNLNLQPEVTGPLPSRQKAALGLVMLGGVVGLVALSGVGVVTGWWGLLASLGSMTVGGLALYALRYRGTPHGVHNDGVMFSSLAHRGAVGWVTGVAITTFYVVLYWFPELIEGWVRLTDPLSQLLRRSPADQWFLYGLLYTLCVMVFGSRMFWRYRHNRYQTVRTASVVFFQLVMAFLLPGLLRALNQPEHYFTYFWPLKPDALYPWFVHEMSGRGHFGLFLLGWGLLASFVATPVLTYLFGKRWYCSWVCGCGGLAETLGDPWRHLSDTSHRAWRVERWSIHIVLVLVVLTTGSLWANEVWGGALLGGGSAWAKSWYGFAIGSVFSGVVGVGFYPLLGSRVWCRFGCPQAAVLGIIQRFFSRFRITTNGGQCISCGNCSTYCEMGIDVRAYAQRGDNIVRASCVGCGICAAVCPRGVLKLESGPVSDRFDGADAPFTDLLTSLGAKPRPDDPNPM